MKRILFWLRWSLRDLRRRWLVVCALALVIALGTGVAAAFTSLSEWRRLSNDASYSQLGMHDLVVSFEQSRVRSDAAIAAVRSIPGSAQLRAVEGRLDLSTQVELTSRGRDLVLPGRIVGVEVTAPGSPLVDRVEATRGRQLDQGDRDQAVALVEQAFAEEYELPTGAVVRTAGGGSVTVIGRAQSPIYLLNGQGLMLGEPMNAVLFLPLATAQRLTGATGEVNEVLVSLTRGADPTRVRGEIESALRAALPQVPFEIALRGDDPGYRMLYDDIDTDQKFWDLVSILFLAAAALATFNLANRVVAAQRREIGVGAALGLRSGTLAVRPLLFGIEIAVLGVAVGIGVGALLGLGITSVLDEVIPLPQWRTPFQPGAFARAALLGAAIPLLGIAYPVVRAVRIEPADAIRTAHIAGGGGRLGRLFGRIPLPGSSIGHLPVRHVLRAPGRTLLTSAGIGAAIAVLVTMFGLLDSMGTALDTGEREQERGAAGRTVVSLTTYYPVSDAQIAAVRQLPEVAAAQPALRVPVRAVGEDTSLDLVVDVLDFRTAIWTPTMRDADERRLATGTVPGGIVLSEKAAQDLGVRPGDTISIRHPRLTAAPVQNGQSGPSGEPGESGQAGQAAFDTVTTPVVVTAVHPNPIRTVAYLDASRAELFGLTGFTNQMQVRPADGVDEDGLRRALIGNPAVAAVAPVTAMSKGMRDMIAQFTDLLGILAGVVLLLALLIAFNAASISADERAREHATMLAFGLRIRRVIGNAMLESLLTGVFGTCLGLLAGVVATWWAVDGLMGSTLPDFAIEPTLSVSTVLTAFALGVVAVTVAPLFTVRRTLGMNIPAALRIVE